MTQAQTKMIDSKLVQCTSDGWTVIMSRGQFGNPVDYFDRDWEEYEAGFGEPGLTYTLLLHYGNLFIYFYFRRGTLAWP